MIGVDRVLDCALDRIARVASAGLAGRSAPPLWCEEPVYIALRTRGRIRRRGWVEATELARAVSTLAGDAAPGEDAESVDTVELCLTHGYADVPLGAMAAEFGNAQRGIVGMEISYQGVIERIAPTQTIATNRRHQKAFELFLDRHDLTAEVFIDRGGKLRRFEARQVLVTPGEPPRAVAMDRGATLVEPKAMDGTTVAQMKASMTVWLLAQVGKSGRMTYKYWPSRGQESEADNPVRQFMATLCLLRLARAQADDRMLGVATRNCDYNIERFFRVHNEIGVVEHEGTAKLGAAALAALAMLEHPEPDRYGPELLLLRRGIDALWRLDGSFRTFHHPTERNDNQNFYPGEALLFWASLLARGHDDALMARCVATFEHYRQWHRRHPNPAFVPWHTQAAALLFEHTNDTRYRDFVFEMNDWLVPMQQWEDAPAADLRGRFYSPSRPDFGPPHASSTGVYLEGLADALRLARDAADPIRARRYERAAWRGLRSIRQLQFRDEIDMFYVSRRERVRGAVRTEAYDNTVRIDNVQHALMALMKLVELPEFAEHSRPRPELLADRSSKGPGGRRRASRGRERPSSAGARQLRHFELVERDIDIAPMLAELGSDASLWLRDTSRQDKVRVQRETNAIFLRSAAKPYPQGMSGEDVHESRPTSTSRQFPRTMRWLADFAERSDAELGRALVVRLAPGGRVHRHVDRGEYYRLRDRYHLVLNSSAGSPLTCGDETVRMRERELWRFDNKTAHEARNDSAEWRVHLIFDLLPHGIGHMISQGSSAA